MSSPGACGDCGVAVGELHDRGCDLEECPICRKQLITCDCCYVANGYDPATLERDHPAVYEHGLTAGQEAVFDAALAAAGGRVPWGSERPCPGDGSAS